MDAQASSAHPVLHYLAVVRAARDFGLPAEELGPLARRCPPGTATHEQLADSVVAALQRHR